MREDTRVSISLIIVGGLVIYESCYSNHKFLVVALLLLFVVPISLLNAGYHIYINIMSSEGNAVATPAAVDLTALAATITTLGESIKQLKSSSEPDKDAISTAVTSLLDAKRTYAKNNGGVGVDGKPWEEPMTKR